MKKIGTLNAQLSRIIAGMGHGDRLVVCDSGLPIPRGKELVDLALTRNIPRFAETLAVILNELEVQEAVVAEEIEAHNPEIEHAIGAMLNGIPVRKVTHEEFKRLAAEDETVALVRTGEASPFANILLISGVTFS